MLDILCIISFFNLFRDAISTFGVRSKAALTTGEYSKLVLTARGGDGSRVCWSVAAVWIPVVAAVVVSGSSQPFALVKQKPVPTGLQGQSPIGAFVELITIIFFWVELQTLGLRTSYVCNELTCWWSLALRWRRRQSRSHRGSRSRSLWDDWEWGKLTDTGRSLPDNLPSSTAEVVLKSSDIERGGLRVVNVVTWDWTRLRTSKTEIRTTLMLSLVRTGKDWIATRNKLLSLKLPGAKLLILQVWEERWA